VPTDTATVSPEQLTRAIARLDLNERVALRLAAGRNLLDNELAAALGVSSAVARDLLRAAIDRVAEDVGMSPNGTWVELRALTVEDWQATARLARAEDTPVPVAAPIEPEPVPVPEPEPEPELEPQPEPEDVEDVERVWGPEDEALPTEAEPAEEAEVVDEPAPATPRRRGRRSPLTIIAGALVLAVVVAVVAFLAGGSDGSSKPVHSAPARSSGPNATLTGRTLRVDVAGVLPAGGTYEAWLFDSLVDARPLGLLHGATTTLTLPRGVDPARFRYLDVSRQAPGSTQEHSGRSVLRAATAGLGSGRAVRLLPLDRPE
jgi:hypothetical protein